MITIELEGKFYEMPSDWNEVNIEMFEKIVKHIGILSEYKSQYQYAIELFSILTKCPIDDLKRMTKGSFEELSKAITWTSGEIKSTGIKRWNINGDDYIAIEKLNDLEMGDVVSLELIISNSNSHELLTNILPILIRKVKVITKSNGEIREIPGDFEADRYDELKELFRINLKVADVNELKDFF